MISTRLQETGNIGRGHGALDGVSCRASCYVKLPKSIKQMSFDCERQFMQAASRLNILKKINSMQTVTVIKCDHEYVHLQNAE